MYKILIVDDEELIRKGLVSRIEYHKFNFKQIIEAANGREALEIIKESTPHIVITDIRMPEKDGIELIRSAKEICPDIRFIILSGYAEFKYVEQALKMGVSDYILKPVVDGDLVKTLNNVIDDINTEYENKEIHTQKEILEKYYENANLEQKVNQIIHNVKADVLKKNEEEQLDFIKLKEDSRYVMALINIAPKLYYEAHSKTGNIDSFKFDILNSINGINSKCDKHVFNNYRDRNQIIVILYHSDMKLLKSEKEAFFGRLLNTIQDSLKSSVTIGLSKQEVVISGNLYRQAKEALLQRLICGNGKVYKYNDVHGTTDLTKARKEFGLLVKYIEKCDVEKIETALKNIFSKEIIMETSVPYIKFIWMEIMNIIIKVGTETKPELLNEFDTNLLAVENLNKFSDIEEVISYLYTLIIDFLKIDKAVDLNSKSKVKMIVQYIKQHYYEDITVNILSDMLAMSPTYFSTIFKKETGKKVINFITEVRVEEACRLLVNTKDSVVDIANKVGYEDAQYFFRVFKKCTGKTPLEYRKGD